MSKTGSLTRKPALLTAVLSLAALAGYAAYRLTTGADPQAQAVQSAAEAGHAHDAAALASALPDVVLDDLAGTPTSLASFAGESLLINFWATWCAPCLREIPMLKAFHADQESITVVGIAIDDLEDVQAYAEDMQFNYPVLVGQAEGMTAAAALGTEVIALPFSVFAAADGAILGIKSGELHPEHLENLAATFAALEAGSIDQVTARERLSDL